MRSHPASGSVWSSPVIADVDADGMAEIIVKHDAIINNPMMVAEAYRQFGALRDGNETIQFDPWTGKLYGRFNRTPPRHTADMTQRRISLGSELL